MTAAGGRRRLVVLTAALAVLSPAAWADKPGAGEKAEKSKHAAAQPGGKEEHGQGHGKAAPGGGTEAEPTRPAAAEQPSAVAQAPVSEAKVKGNGKDKSASKNHTTAEADGGPQADTATGKARGKSSNSAAAAAEPRSVQATPETTAPVTPTPSATSASVAPAATAEPTPVQPEPAATTPEPAATPKPDSAAPRTQRPSGRLARVVNPSRPASTTPATGDTLPASFAGTDPVFAAGTPGSAARADRTPGTTIREQSEPPRTVTRTITHVLALVPAGVWLAIGLLAALGLILAATTIVQTVRRRHLERIRRRLVADVGLLQSALLPELPAQIGGAAVTAAYRPAEGLAAGGDFFDAFELPGGRTAVIVGDVAGHGREVVPLTAAVRYSLRAYLEAGLSPRAVLNVAGHALDAQLDGSQVTVVVAVHDPATARLTYACAGHWPPLLIGVPGAAVTACSSPPLGAGMPTGRRQTSVAMGPGSAACFFTDGLTDVVVPEGRLGMEGLQQLVDELGPELSAHELLDRVVTASAGQPDDMAACVLAPTGPVADDGMLRIEELEIDAAGLSSARVERFLRACGADVAATAQAIDHAGLVTGLAGTAVLEVHTDATGVGVWVTEPAAATLRIAGSGAGANALAA